MMLCEACGEMAVDKTYERGGSGFVGQRYIQANDNQYLVEYTCQECGAFHGCAIEDIADDEKLQRCPHCGETALQYNGEQQDDMGQYARYWSCLSCDYQETT